MSDTFWDLLLQHAPGSFTPLSAFVGGVLIGLGAVVLLYFQGAIAGISGILGASFVRHGVERAWRVAFLLGIPFGVWLFAKVSSQITPWVAIEFEAAPWILAAAGTLVGVGTQLGSGCTSGHGVCGIARRSPRSIVATITFLFFGFLTVFLVRHVLV